MKRNMDLIRELMLKLESLPMNAGDLTHIPPDHPAMAIDGKTPEEIDFHLGVLCDAFFYRSRRLLAYGGNLVS